VARLMREHPRPQIDVEGTDYGLRLFTLRKISEKHTHVRVTNLVFPNAFHIPMSREMTITQWHVPIGELTTESSVVVHAKSVRRISYGEVVKFATVPSEPPQISDAELKKPSEFRLIGRKDIQRVDVPSKVNGSAKYGIDVRLPGMVYASVLESPAEGAKVAKVNTDEVLKIAGVKRVLPLPFGVAVVAETMPASLKGRKALKVEWDYSAAAAKGLDSDQALEEYARRARDPNADAMDAFKKGDARKALADAAKTIEAEYQTVHVYHAQMEPMNCVARVAADGQSAEVWTGSQFAALHAVVVANILKTTPDKIQTHQQFLGGGFGRRISPDAVAQAVVLSNITKETVKLTLTREDDFAAGRLRRARQAVDDEIAVGRHGVEAGNGF